MGISLKKDEMVQFLDAAKTPEENFTIMLWGTVYAKASRFQDRSGASEFMIDEGGTGVTSSLNDVFCYAGLTDRSLYVVALDSYNTSKIISTIRVPFEQIAKLNVRKAPFGASYTAEVHFAEDYVGVTVKSTSLGTNIKDQKERMNLFLTQIEALQGSIPGSAG